MAARDPEPKCVIKFPDGVYRGSKVRLQGNIPPDAQRFSINLQCGPRTDIQEQVALHVNPRFNDMNVVRNQYAGGEWGREENSGGMPLSKDADFETVIECNEQAFTVSFNGKHFCEFAHRMPYHRATHVMVDGDVSLRLVSFPSTE
ncbi:galectin-7 [Helicoverpa armigera]|uniref:galectin-7 n=1 Tax=Helicoverpa armigera TaxID=29058 RepID=UPI0030831A34